MTRSVVADARRLERARILRGIIPGIRWPEAWRISSATGFREALVDAGVDPEPYAHLTSRLRSRPPSKDNKVIARTERRRQLKAAGIERHTAEQYAASEGAFQLAMRRLQKGIPL